MPFEEALHGILLPLQERGGSCGHTGRISVAVEHYVTSQIKQKLHAAMNQLPVAEFGATVVVAFARPARNTILPRSPSPIVAEFAAVGFTFRSQRPHPLLSNLCREVAPTLTILPVPSQSWTYRQVN